MSNFINELGFYFFEEIMQYDYSELIEGDVDGTIDLEEYGTLEKPSIVYSIKENQTVEVKLFHDEYEEAELIEKEEIEKEFTESLKSFLETIIYEYDTQYKTADIKQLKCIKSVIGEDDQQFCTEGKVYDIVDRYVCGQEFSFVIIDDNDIKHYFSVCESEEGTTYEDWFIAA
jgi:hypothetical protein